MEYKEEFERQTGITIAEFKEAFNKLCECVSQIVDAVKLIILVTEEFLEYLKKQFESKFGIKVTNPCLMGMPLSVGIGIPYHRQWILANK